MPVSQTRISVHDLELGMFVSKLDRPWHETPFPIQGFVVKTEKDRETLANFCDHVYIDTEDERQEERDETTPSNRTGDGKPSDSEPVKLPPINIPKPVDYPVQTRMADEIRFCRGILIETYTGISRLYESNQLSPELTMDLLSSSKSLTDSIIRNPNSLPWLTRLETYDSLTYQHALRMTVWALSLGRHLGLSATLLSNLATGCMLSQVGKISLPKRILDREGRLEGEELTQFQGYVNASVELLKDERLNTQIIRVVQNHQERHNGRGFPRSLPGNDVPLLARIAGIAYHFEFLLNPSPDSGQKAMTPSKALNSIYHIANIEFHEDLVHAFIQSVGLYPVGSQVELSDGQIGVVLSHTPESRLLPRVVVLIGSDKKPLPQSRIVDLKALSKAEGSNLTIRRCLPDRTLKVKQKDS